MSNKRKIKFRVVDEDLPSKFLRIGERTWEVPVYSDLIDGEKRQVGVGVVTKELDGSYSYEAKLTDPEAIAMTQGPEVVKGLSISPPIIDELND